MKPTLKLGQTLYSLNVGNACRGREQKLSAVKVTKLGRKYFECSYEDHWRPVVYHIDTWSEKTEYSSSTRLYVSPQEWEDEKRANELSNSIAEAFSYGRNKLNISLDKLEQINRIILGL